MTNKELDEARAQEAVREVWGFSTFSLDYSTHRAVVAAARLAREGWKPEDPILKEAEAISKGLWKKEEFNPDEWAVDRAIVVALRRGIEIGKDAT